MNQHSTDAKVIRPAPADLEVVPTPGHDGPQPVHYGYRPQHDAYQYHPPPLKLPLLGPLHLEPTPNRIFGLRRATFWLLIVLLLLILGAALGGGIGGSIAVENAKQKSTSTSPNTPTISSASSSSQPTASSTSTTSAASTTVTVIGPPVPTIGRLPLNCPAINGTKETVTLGARSSTFTLTCGANYVRSEFDILAIISYSLKECLTACASYNRKRDEHPESPGQRCAAVVFNANLYSSVTLGDGTCFLKYSTLAFVQSNDDGGITGQLDV